MVLYPIEIELLDFHATIQSEIAPTFSLNKIHNYIWNRIYL